MKLMVQKISGVILLISAFISTNNAFAEEDKKVHLNVAHSMNALITFQHCKVNSDVKDEKIVVLSDIIANEEAKVKNLFKQTELWSKNYKMIEEQSASWKKEYKQCTEELIDANDWPWYKFDLKSVITGTLIPLIIKLAWL